MPRIHIPCQPSLWNSISPILDNMAMIADKEEGATIWEIELHSNETISMSWKMVEGDSLTEINRTVVECLPIQRNLGGVSSQSSFFQRSNLHLSSVLDKRPRLRR